MVDETGVGEEGVEVGTWEDSHRPPCAIKVGSDCVLVVQLGFRKVDVAECGRAGGKGNVKNDVGGGRRMLGGWVVTEGVAQVAATGRTHIVARGEGDRGPPIVDRGKVGGSASGSMLVSTGQISSPGMRGDGRCL